DKVKLLAYEPGQVIFRQIDVADALYLVRMGHMKVSVMYADGQSIVLSYLSRSQFFGEIGLLGKGKRTATCSAIDHVEVVRIDKEEFEEMMVRFPEIRSRMEAIMADRQRMNESRGKQLS